MTRQSDAFSFFVALFAAIPLGLFAIAAQAADASAPVIDNERITVWEVTTPLPPSAGDFIAIDLDGKGSAKAGHKGEVPGEAGRHMVVIAFKDFVLPPIDNPSGYPMAFPRPHAEKLLETDRAIVWRYGWIPGEASPMHFHDKDALVIFRETGSLDSITPDGKSVTNDYKAGEIRFNRRDRVHKELLAKGSESAIITELK
jgi:hypothetical protein